ncbi:MAG: DnaJ domain-containing protein [Polyangiales bacterium]
MLSDRVLDEHLDRIDYYTLLGVARDAAPTSIRDAFHRFAMRFHPDQHIGDQGAQARAGRIFKRGAEGYRILLDVALRARYDSALNRGEVRLTQESERRAVVAEAATPAQTPLPADVKPLYERAKEAFDKGDLKNAKAFLTLVTRRTSHPTVQALARDLLEAERTQLRRR